MDSVIFLSCMVLALRLHISFSLSMTQAADHQAVSPAESEQSAQTSEIRDPSRCKLHAWLPFAWALDAWPPRRDSHKRARAGEGDRFILQLCRLRIDVCRKATAPPTIPQPCSDVCRILQLSQTTF
jgi:hypothetical protein